MSETIIIDNGTNTIRAGFSDDDVPRAIIPTVLGRPFSNGESPEEEEEINEQMDIFIGDEALEKGGILQLFHPITKGEIKDFSNMELIWKQIFYNELLTDVKTQSVIMTEPPFASSSNKVEMAEILFDKIGVESLYIGNTSTLALYANGKTTGTVVDIGYQTSSFAPIFEGFVLKHTLTKIDTGGKDLTDYFCHILSLRNDNDKFISESQKSIINELKEKICEVGDDYDSQVKKCLDSKLVETHTLPDGSKVFMTHEKYQCPELLFQPQLFNKNHGGIHEETYRSIKLCDEDIKKDLFQNVILCGGSSLFLNIRKKFEKELQSLAPTGKSVKVIAPPERKYSSWLGGAILNSLPDFKTTLFVSKNDWIEAGENILYDKYF